MGVVNPRAATGRHATSIATTAPHDARRPPIHDITYSTTCERVARINPVCQRLRCRDCRVFADFCPLWAGTGKLQGLIRGLTTYKRAPLFSSPEGSTLDTILTTVFHVVSVVKVLSPQADKRKGRLYFKSRSFMAPLSRGSIYGPIPELRKEF